MKTEQSNTTWSTIPRPVRSLSSPLPYTVTYSMMTEVTTVVCGSTGAVGSGACSDTTGLLETLGVGVGVDIVVAEAEAPSVTYCVMTDSKKIISVLGPPAQQHQRWAQHPALSSTRTRRMRRYRSHSLGLQGESNWCRQAQVHRIRVGCLRCRRCIRRRRSR
jgi:hypothetical protein